MTDALRLGLSFWSMIFHYVPSGENMCQTASMAAVLNGLRDPKTLDSESDVSG